jgi:hypothetical protein
MADGEAVSGPRLEDHPHPCQIRPNHPVVPVVQSPVGLRKRSFAGDLRDGSTQGVRLALGLRARLESRLPSRACRRRHHSGRSRNLARPATHHPTAAQPGRWRPRPGHAIFLQRRRNSSSSRVISYAWRTLTLKLVGTTDSAAAMDGC